MPTDRTCVAVNRGSSWDRPAPSTVGIVAIPAAPHRLPLLVGDFLRSGDPSTDVLSVESHARGGQTEQLDGTQLAVRQRTEMTFCWLMGDGLRCLFLARPFEVEFDTTRVAYYRLPAREAE